MNSISMLINGEMVGASNGATFTRLSPLDGSVATTAPAATTVDVKAAVDAAAQAFPAWAAMEPDARRALLMQAAHALEAKTDAFVAAMVAETGTSGIWASLNVRIAANILKGAAALSTQFQASPSLLGGFAIAMNPLAGVVLGIAPWNAPIILALRAIAMPLASGHTVVLKGCELCPATHGLITQSMQEAGLPKGVVNFITNAPAQADAIMHTMIEHPAVCRVNFTGSTHIGRSIENTYTKPTRQSELKPSSQRSPEMLGNTNSPWIDAIFRAFRNSYQVHMATEKMSTDETMSSALTARLEEYAKPLPWNDSRNSSQSSSEITLSTLSITMRRAPIH